MSNHFRVNFTFSDIVELSSIHLYNTRLLGRFAPIFYLNVEHVLFVYILKQKQKKVCEFHEKITWILKI